MMPAPGLGVGGWPVPGRHFHLQGRRGDTSCWNRVLRRERSGTEAVSEGLGTHTRGARVLETRSPRVRTSTQPAPHHPRAGGLACPRPGPPGSPPGQVQGEEFPRPCRSRCLTPSSAPSGHALQAERQANATENRGKGLLSQWGPALPASAGPEKARGSKIHAGGNCPYHANLHQHRHRPLLPTSYKDIHSRCKPSRLYRQPHQPPHCLPASNLTSTLTLPPG